MKRLFLLVCLILCSCSNISTSLQSKPIDLNPSTTLSERDEDGCIPPLVTFAYPYGDSGLMNPGDHSMLLPDNWKLITSIPGKKETRDNASYNFQLIRPKNGYDELWMTDESKGSIYFVRTDTREWTKVNEFQESFSHYFLFADSNNAIWLTYRYEQAEPPSFWRYDEAKNTFILMYGDASLSSIYKTSDVLSYQVDREGVFWAGIKVKEDDNPISTDILYRFDPITMTGQVRYTFTQDDYPTIEIDHKGNIFFADIKNSTVFNYSPVTHQIRDYKIPLDISSFPWVSLFFDNQNRLWINDLGWFDFSTDSDYPQWFTVIRSPIFIYYLTPSGIWHWTSPKMQLEDENRVIWFSATSGTGWVNDHKGKWCLITTYDSNVFEDSQNNIWVLINGAFYRQDPME
ncbi:MAG: hypothetical protein GYA20_06690 [Chloroflexi bacterium]|nr:hypothetical protein [Chloroflexota bacterium]